MIQNPLRRDAFEGDWSFSEFGRNTKNRPSEELESGIGNLEMVQNHGNLARLKMRVSHLPEIPVGILVF